MNDRANVLAPAIEFAQILANDPRELNQAELSRGNNVLLVYNDDNFGSRFTDLKNLKISVLKMAIEDISGRAQILSSNTIGVVFLENKLQTFLTPLSAVTNGTVVYKIGIKNTIAFQKWRQGESSDIAQEDINAGVYKLIHEWSKLIDPS